MPASLSAGKSFFDVAFAPPYWLPPGSLFACGYLLYVSVPLRSGSALTFDCWRKPGLGAQASASTNGKGLLAQLGILRDVVQTIDSREVGVHETDR